MPSSKNIHAPFGDIRFQKDVYLTLKDGTRLAADIYKPTGEGPFPVLLMRQPYGKDIASTVVYAPPVFFARQGFLVVIQDVRGRGKSEGTFQPFIQEQEDGLETIDWAADLPDSNGRVGMYGFSYQGYTQLAPSLAQPDPLKAIAPHMTAFDLYSGWFYRDGLLQLASTLGWGNQMLREDVWRSQAREAYQALETSWLNPSALSRQLPVSECDPLTREDAPTYVRDWLSHENYDPFWKPLDILAQADQIRIPVFHLSGWYDFYTRGSFDGYRSLHKRDPNNQYLVAGPWVHLPWGDRAHLGETWGSAAALDTDSLLVQWFKKWLTDEEPSESLSGAKYFLLGSNHWESDAQWPPADAELTKLHLTSRGRANSRFGDGQLTYESSSGPSDTYNYDPEVPVLAPGGSYSGSLAWGPSDLSSSQQGNNLLVYTSPPFPEETRLVGQVTASLSVDSSAPETAWVCRLSRVTKNGQAWFLTLGCACWSRDPENASIRIHFDDTACTFFAGESLRLDIASSAFPLLIRHPNTSTSPARISDSAEFERATQVIHHNADQPSFLECLFVA